ncbi:MAG: Trm112 family protein [Catenulispora sp.]
MIESSLLEILACPKCHAPLREDADAPALACTNSECALVYPIRDGIPVLLIDEATKAG